jgi:hypothetical protein
MSTRLNSRSVIGAEVGGLAGLEGYAHPVFRRGVDARNFRCDIKVRTRFNRYISIAVFQPIIYDVEKDSVYLEFPIRSLDSRLE